MDIVKIRHQYQITVSRRALLILLSLVSFSLSSGIVLAVAPILRDAVILTQKNAEDVRQATEQQRQLRSQIEQIKREYNL